jgi:hypothetical protein
VKSLLDLSIAKVSTMKDASAIEMNQVYRVMGRNMGFARGFNPFGPKNVRFSAVVTLTPYG